MKKIFLSVLLVLFTAALFAEEGIEASNDIDASDFRGTVQQAMSSNDYMVTAGDVYTLTYAANGSPVSYTIPVDSTYKIRVANLAVLDVGGRSYLTLKKQVEEIVQKNYPLSGVQFVLLNPASFKVTVKGEVSRTTERTAWALTRLSSVIAGTTTAYSSTRNVSVTSINGKTQSYDLFKATRFGDLSQNPYVRPGDIVTINRIDRKVTISGSIERPGTYELLPGENLSELINYYGNGTTAMADLSRVEITRILDDDNKTGNKIYLDEENLNQNFPLLCYDFVNIANYKSLRPVMFVEGAIQTDEGVTLEASNRRVIQFENDMTYDSLIQNNRALFASAASDIENAYILRKSEVIPINVFEILFNKEYRCNEVVLPGDVLMIPFKQLFVTVSGAVYAPGRYPYIPDRTADYYIALAGGFIKEKNSGDAMDIRDMNGKKLSKKAVITPESMIIAKSNSAMYRFNQYSGVITTILSILATSLSAFAAIQSINH